MDIISRHLRLEEIESFSHREIPTLCLFQSESRGSRCNFQHEKEEELAVPAMPVSSVLLSLPEFTVLGYHPQPTPHGFSAGV